jgi:8-oxo-dGTP pyrophosphatase MutT (NUDIX family)
MTDPSSTFATPRVVAAALCRDASGHVLLVHPTHKDTWDLPGGYVESGEFPAAACQRGITEELGLDWLPHRLISVDWIPHGFKDEKLFFLFDCGDLGTDDPRRRTLAGFERVLL